LDYQNTLFPTDLGDDVELRRHIANHVNERCDVIVADTVATFPSESRRLDASYCVRLGKQTTTLLAEAILEARLDSRGNGLSELAALVNEREVSPEQLFTFVHIAMNTTIDELSLDARAGANTEPWPQASQIVRRAAFELLSAWTTRLMSSPLDSSIEDSLTTLHTRPVLDAVLEKECCRAERFEHWVSMMLIDIDNLSAINKAHGYGVGDRILERMGILLRTYFRQHDWVTRYEEDAIAVLLPETNPEDAMTLAERTRTMIEERLTFRDYRTEQRAIVTVSIAVTSARALQGEPVDHQIFSRECEAALERAKVSGRNRVVHVQLLPRLMSLNEATQILNTDLEGLERLVTEGRLDPVNAGRHVRLERQAVEALAAESR
jgi:diguanylate cyclase (GGDEF)-like protein/excisionase family DNA binding protein